MGPAPSLLMSPQNRYNGYIMGTFPAITVQPGDHFVTGVGCEYNHSCYVTFRLDYMTATGYIGTFWQWREQSDRNNYSANVDLSPLAGRSIRFILTILATGSASGDRVRWIGPAITRKEDDTQHPTITPSPTFTPTPPNNGMPGAIVSSPVIRKLHMLDANNGWALGDNYVLRTNNGGTTWYNVSPSDVADGVTGGYFPNTTTAWMLTHYSEVGQGSLYRTTDGGFNWTRNDVPFSAGSLQFLDNNRGFLMSILGAAMNKQSVAIYQTNDGGRSWTMNYINDPTYPGAGNSLPLGGHRTA